MPFVFEPRFGQVDIVTFCHHKLKFLNVDVTDCVSMTDTDMHL